MAQWWLMGRDQVPLGPVTTELVIQGIRAGKVPGDTLACEVGGTAWRGIRSVGRFAPSFAKLRIDGPTLVDLDEGPVTEAEDPPTLTSTKMRYRADAEEEHTVADGSLLGLDDFGPTQRADEPSEVTIVDRLGRHSEPPP
ncbi:MAG TPA: hypothetical protein VH062_07335 [Polyangiaceae bacterium]|jgi:hypothetical protein|nr:hypothetical protein [Polyangiaceae bacterium]